MEFFGCLILKNETSEDKICMNQINKSNPLNSHTD